IIRGKRVKPQLEQAVHLAGMLLLIGLMVLITVNDLRKLLG
ncbi:RIP metalloprotease RseP, partial [Candidatus Beckwithbacteria bacterium CG_4_10_14_0_2_um_filter_47_25]